MKHAIDLFYQEISVAFEPLATFAWLSAKHTSHAKCGKVEGDLRRSGRAAWFGRVILAVERPSARSTYFFFLSVVS
jgi:hypothetical protein